MSPSGSRRLVIAGLPRCGTTLLATFLASQKHCTFVTDYLASFTDAASRLHVGWAAPLSRTQRRVALAIVRDQLLRFRHPVLVPLDDFTTLGELHRAVLAELARPGDRVVGHKLLLDDAQLETFLEQTDGYLVVLYRDPRDAALSYFHRTGAGVEQYIERWRRTVAFLGRTHHARLFAIRYESIVTDPRGALGPLFEALELSLDVDRAALTFRGPAGELSWRGNATFEEAKAPFDPSAIGRWRALSQSPIVRFAGWAARRELRALGYPAGPPTSWREGARWSAHRAAHELAREADTWWARGRGRLLDRLAPPVRHA